jgi:hypothetical protein
LSFVSETGAVVVPESAPPVPPCTYDAECTLNGCGGTCNHYDTEPFISVCLADRWLEDKDYFCGCVSGACRWFSQE